MKFLEAVLILSGMIIGVGMFGIPFSFAASGFWLGVAELAVLTGVVLLVHLLYGEVVLATPEQHRLPGYVKIYLGKGAMRLAWFSAFFGITGTLLAYLLMGSVFLNNLSQIFLKFSNNFFWLLVLVLVSATITFFPLRRGATINGVLSALLISFLVFLSFLLFPYFRTGNLSGFNFKNIFVPYGVLLFSLAGGVVVPDLVSFLGKDRMRARQAIVMGSLLPSAVYVLFATAVVGAVGSAVSREAIQSLSSIVGENIAVFGALIGFLAVFTSLIVLSASFQELFRLDLHLSRIVAWLAASFLPLFLFFLGFRNFISIIGAVGALAVGIDSVLIIASYSRIHPVTARSFWPERRGNGIHKKDKISYFSMLYSWRFAVYIMIAAGVVYELYQLLLRQS